MKIQKILALAMASATTFTFAACGSSGGGSSAPADNGSASADTSSASKSGESAAAGGASIKLGIWDTNQEKGITETLKDFTAQSGINVTVEVTPWDQYWTMLEAAATGGALPDVFWMHSNESYKYMSNDMLMDLTDKIAGSGKLDMSKFPSGLNEMYSLNGKQYAIPKDVDTIGLWYNKTMFDEAGIPYPDGSWKWADVTEAAAKLTTADRFGFCSQLDANQENWYNFVYQNGGYIISEDKKKSGMDDPKTIEAIEFAISFMKDKTGPDSTTTTENTPVALLESGKVAMAQLGSWQLAELAGNEYIVANCDVAPLPAGPDGKRATIYNGLGWTAPTNAPNADASWQLLEFLGTKEAQEKLSSLGVAISAYEGTADTWAKSNEKFNLKIYVDQIPEGVVRPYSQTTITWENMTKEKLAPVWALQTPVADACAEIAASMNETLATES